jgi:L-seryl-tRNA(Ser) seleniumtransferase
MDALRALPSVDALLRDGRTEMLIERHGRSVVTEAIRAVLARIRVEIASQHAVATDETLLDRVALEVQALVTPSLRPVFNLTGTILHTNLGRAPH